MQKHISFSPILTRNVFKKDKRRRIKKRRTDGRKLKMNIVKWTAILANFVRE